MKKLIVFLLFLVTLCKASELPETYMQFKCEVINMPVKKFEISFIKEPAFKPMIILLATACVNHAMIRYNSKHQKHGVAVMNRKTATVYLTGVTATFIVAYIEENRHNKKFKK